MQLPTRTVPILLCALMVFAAACASGGTSSANARDCALRQTDSVFVATGPVYRDCAVDRKARLASRMPRIDYTPSAPGCVVSVVEFVVDTAGSPEMRTARIARSTDASFTQSIMAVVPSLKYEPAQRGGRPVRQIVSLEQKAAMTVTVVSASGAGGRPPGPPRMPTC